MPLKLFNSTNFYFYKSVNNFKLRAMYLKSLMIRSLFSLVFIVCSTFAHFAQEKRAMTLEDLMNFQSIGNSVLSDNGKFIAYEVKMERNDGYGVIQATNGMVYYRVERGEKPVFSNDARWVMFTQIPLFAETEKKKPGEGPYNNIVLVNLSNGIQSSFENIKQAKFSNNSKFLLVHYQFINDSLLSKGQIEKLKKAGSNLGLISLDNMSQKVLNFVDLWTADSLSRNLVYTLKDTLKSNNGLYHLKLNVNDLPSSVIDTIGNVKFSSFSWHEKSSALAYMKAEDIEIPKKETAELYRLNVGRDLPQLLVSQSDAPVNTYLPFDNNLTWSNDGRRLFFGFRKSFYSEAKTETPKFDNVLDSLRSLAEVDVWHVNDPFIKTNEKASWNRLRKQNMISAVHTADSRIQILANEEVPIVQTSGSSAYVAGFSSEPYTVRSTWDGGSRDFYGININTGQKTLVASELRDLASVSPVSHFALYFHKANWHSYNLLSGSIRYLTHNSGVPFYDEDHDTPGDPSSYRMMGWLDDGVSVILYDKYDIWLANLEFGTLTNITKGEGRKNKIIFRIKKLDSKPLYSLKNDLLLEGFNEVNKQKALYIASLKSPGVKMLRDDKMNLSWLHASVDQKTVIFTRESYNVFPDLWSADIKFKNITRLSNLNNQLDAFFWGTSELVEFENTDGVPLQGVLIKPGNYDASKTYPVFVYYYEKSSQRLHYFNQTVINHRPSFGYYASNGYCVYLPDIHFEVGYPGMSAVKSLVPAVQKIIDMGVADKNAIGLHGHSWSGYQTAFVVTKTDIFKAAIAGAPVSNMTSAYSGIRWGTGVARQFQYERGQSRIGPSMFENLDLYIENSPVFFADKIKTPLLLMHGDKDEAVPWEQSIEMYLAMRRLGKDVIFLQYRNEPHHPQKYPNKIDYTIRMKEYFDYHLREMEPADWIVKGIPYSGN